MKATEADGQSLQAPSGGTIVHIPGLAFQGTIADLAGDPLLVHG